MGQRPHRLDDQAVRQDRPPPPHRFHIRVGQHLLTAEDPLPAELRDALAQTN
jgi:hypothetical protein